MLSVYDAAIAENDMKRLGQVHYLEKLLARLRFGRELGEQERLCALTAFQGDRSKGYYYAVARMMTLDEMIAIYEQCGEMERLDEPKPKEREETTDLFTLWWDSDMEDIWRLIKSGSNPLGLMRSKTRNAPKDLIALVADATAQVADTMMNTLRPNLERNDWTFPTDGLNLGMLRELCTKQGQANWYKHSCHVIVPSATDLQWASFVRESVFGESAACKVYWKPTVVVPKPRTPVVVMPTPVVTPPKPRDPVVVVPSPQKKDESEETASGTTEEGRFFYSAEDQETIQLAREFVEIIGDDTLKKELSGKIDIKRLEDAYRKAYDILTDKLNSFGATDINEEEKRRAAKGEDFLILTKNLILRYEEASKFDLFPIGWPIQSFLVKLMFFSYTKKLPSLLFTTRLLRQVRPDNDQEEWARELFADPYQSANFIERFTGPVFNIEKQLKRWENDPELATYHFYALDQYVLGMNGVITPEVSEIEIAKARFAAGDD